MNCKVIFGDDIYRLLTVPSSYDELRKIIQTKLNFDNLTLFKLKYKDGEDELIMLNNQEDFKTALLSCEVENIKSLKIYVFTHKEGPIGPEQQITKPYGSKDKKAKLVGVQKNENIPRGRSRQVQKSAFALTYMNSAGERLKYELREPGKEEIRSNEKSLDYKVQFLSKIKKIVFDAICGQIYECVVTLKNSGENRWPKNSYFACVNGLYKGKIQKIPFLGPGEEYEVNLILEASIEQGRQLSQWRLFYKEKGEQKNFGTSFFIETNNIQQSGEEESKVSFEKLEKKTEESRSLMKTNQDKYKMAEILNDMFPGNLEAKVKFIESCPSDCDIYKIVDKYMLALRKKQTRQPFVVNSRSNFDISI